MCVCVCVFIHVGPAFLQMQNNLGHYHESTMKLLQKVRAEVPVSVTEEPRHSQDKPSPHTTEKVKAKPAAVPRVVYDSRKEL